MKKAAPSFDLGIASEDLTALVKDAAELLRTKGEAAFEDFRTPGRPLAPGRGLHFCARSSGKQQVVGCGIYSMQMDRSFVEDMVNRAADLVAHQGRQAFAQLRDKTGHFVFMDTYIFIDSPDGTDL